MEKRVWLCPNPKSPLNMGDTQLATHLSVSQPEEGSPGGQLWSSIPPSFCQQWKKIITLELHLSNRPATSLQGHRRKYSHLSLCVTGCWWLRRRIAINRKSLQDKKKDGVLKHEVDAKACQTTSERRKTKEMRCLEEESENNLHMQMIQFAPLKTEWTEWSYKYNKSSHQVPEI